MISVRIRRLHPSVPLPAYQTPGAAGFDLAASEDVLVPPSSIALVPTGLVIQVPDGHFLGIFARSSTPLKRGLMIANGVGVIDRDYCGPADEIKVQVLNFTQQAVQVKKGDRLAQGLFLPVTHVTWEESDRDLREDSRGGFGATGG
jgi:dUTP pyrophosphatase